MNSSSEKRKNRMIVFLCTACVIFAFSTVWFASGESHYRKQSKLISERAVSSLCESLDSISTSLKKSVYTADSEALEKIGNELCRQAASAKENLGMLALDAELCDRVYRFLSQVGDYTVAVSRNKSISQSEKNDRLQKLSRYAEGLSGGLSEICLDYYNGDVSLGDVLGNLSEKGESIPEDFYERLSDAAQTVKEYPTLIYDGPFSDSRSSKKSLFLQDKNELTYKEAMKKVSDIFSVPESSLKREKNILSEPMRYCFSFGGNDVTVTARGGYICSLLSDSFAYEENIGAEEAIKRGREYLEKLGYGGMKSSYYSIYDGICTVNYVYEKDGTVFYGDLIKVGIALDTGKLVALDAKNYLLNHCDRKLPERKISDSEAKAMVLESLEVISVRQAVIPLDTGKEAYCLELHCRDKEKNEALIYLNAFTGRQEDLLILLYSDGGILTK